MKRAQKKSSAPQTPKSQGRKKSKSTSSSWLKKILMWMATLGVWACVIVGAILTYYAVDLPDVDDATLVERRSGIRVLAQDGQVIATSGDLYGEAVQLHDLPVYLPQAVMATEDRRFYDHFGVDIIGLGRALVTNLISGRVRQGGSTLTQQVAKNLFLSPERSLKRKVQELLLAFWLEHKFSKDQIFTLYLNRVYLGAGTYGVEAAAQKYFSKSARKLSLYESALIAGLLKAPSRYNPQSSQKRSEERTNVVLQNMINAGYLTEKQVAQAKKDQAKVFKTQKSTRAGRYFADWVMDQVRDYVGDSKTDYIVYTTLDLDLQKAAQLATRKILEASGNKLQVSQAASVVLSPDGAVRAMVGGRDYGESQFNRATQAQRQPGSSFKPFVFLAALEKGIEEDDIFIDQPVKIGSWSPKNYSGQYEGEMSLTYALSHSVNTVAAQLIERVGVPAVQEVAHRLGITSDLTSQASLALGTSEVNLLELTASYGPFANGGSGIFPYGIAKITERDGRVVYERTGSGSGQVIDSKTLGAMNRMMADVMTNGTGRNAAIGFQTGGKSGTSQSFRDAWFIGYSADYITGVWMGNDDETPMKKVSGSGLPAELWHEIMTTAHRGKVERSLPGDAKIVAPLDKVKGFFERLFGGD